MLARTTFLSPQTTIRRTRYLPAPGRILVRVGQDVTTNDPIAECSHPARRSMLDAARALGLQRSAVLPRAIERSSGEHLQKGDIIAQTGGMFARVLRAPEDCEIVAINRGQVLLEFPAESFTVPAGMNGKVVGIIPERGVVIESNGLLIQGVWGNDQTGEGILRIAARAPEEEFTRALVDVSWRGAVLLGGHAAQADALKAAAELPLKGLILASITGDLLPMARTMPFPIVLMEGFGRLALNTWAFRLLLSHAGQDATLNAHWNPSAGVIPEVIMPSSGTNQELQEEVEFQPGQTVKIVRPPYTSQVGVLQSLRPGQVLLASGMRAAAADVRMQNNEIVTVPLANLVVLSTAVQEAV